MFDVALLCPPGHQPHTGVQSPKGVALHKSAGSVRVSEGLRVTFVDAKKIRGHAGSEKERLSRFPAKGNFTPNPGEPRDAANQPSSSTRHPNDAFLTIVLLFVH